MIEEASASALAGLLVLLLLISAFFSGSETALLTLNRYRLRHRARQGHLGARLAERLLARPDHLISLMLIGSNVANTLATALVTLLALRIGGPAGVAVASIGFAFVIMLFTDIMPKTMGALRAEKLGVPAAFIYYALLKVALPVVWIVAAISNGLLRLFGIRESEMLPAAGQHLTLEELRTLVADAGALLPRRRQRMLMAILELEDMIVDEIMIPDNEVKGIDLESDWDTIIATIAHSSAMRLPVYRGNIQHLAGLLHVPSLVAATAGKFDRAALEGLMTDPFFVPEGTSLHSLLVQFQRSGQRTAFVVDEYGDIQGIATIEDILDEILGEFSPQQHGTGSDGPESDVRKADQAGTWVVNAGMNVRALNRRMHWELPTDGPTTLNGLILERLETFPEPGTLLRLDGYEIEVLETGDNVISTARVRPPAPAAPA